MGEHVLEDLGHVEGLRILDGGPCGIGIESTVLKLDLENQQVVILRKGGVTKGKLERVLADGFSEGALKANVTVVYSEKLSASADTMNEKEQSAQGKAQDYCCGTTHPQCPRHCSRKMCSMCMRVRRCP